MPKNWRILTEKEIKILTEEELMSYLLWVKKQKAMKQDDLSAGKAILNKLIEIQESQKFSTLKLKENEELARIRKELKA